jgi:hypothetical protein
LGKIFEEQEDGSLKSIEYPASIIKSVNLYLWLRRQALTLEEIKFVVTEPELKFQPK